MHPDAEQLVEDIAQLASPPEVYYRLERLITEPHVSLDDIAQVIRTDPDLTARLLRLANSAFYGFPAKIESVSRALATIGTRQLRDLVLATTVVRLFSQISLGRIDMDTFWHHSMLVGLLAREIARELNEPNGERFYLVGLLHDIGRLVLYLKKPGRASEVLVRCEETSAPVHEVEQTMLGYDHGELGAALLSRWRLPEAVTEPVRFHHRPDTNSVYLLEAQIVCIANGLVHAGDERYAPVSERLLLELGIDDHQQVAARTNADAQLGEMLGLFGI